MISNENNTILLKDGRKLGYAVYGDIKGKPIFYFHGWPTSRFHATDLNTLAKKYHIKLISVDRPGIGLSDFKKARTLLDWPDDVVELADQLHIKTFGVMGVSGGGPYAAACAYKIPQKLTKTAIVVGIAPTYVPKLLDGMHFLTKFGWTNYAKYPLLRKGATLLHYINAKYGPSFGLHRFMFGAKKDKQVLSDPKIREGVRRGYKETFRTGYRGAEQDLELYTNDWGFKLTDIKTKVFLFFGEVDQNVPIAMGNYYHSQIKNSKLFTYPNEGHLIAKTHAEEILKTFATDVH